jgi:hypothetical protein
LWYGKTWCDGPRNRRLFRARVNNHGVCNACQNPPPISGRQASQKTMENLANKPFLSNDYRLDAESMCNRYITVLNCCHNLVFIAIYDI